MDGREASVHPADVVDRGSWWVVLLTVALAVPACAGEGRSFTAEELPELVLQPAEAPAGTEYFQDGSGPASAEDLAQGVEEASARWTELGFEEGFVALFRSPDLPLPPPDPNAIPVDAVLIGNSVLLFPDPDGASQGLEVLRSLVVPDTVQGSEAVTADDLGEEAIGFTFDSGPVGKPGAIYAFRVGNAMFVVAGSGSVEAPELLAIARRIADRAQGETS